MPCRTKTSNRAVDLGRAILLRGTGRGALDSNETATIGGSAFIGACGRAVRDNRGLYTLVLLHMVVAFAVSASTGVPYTGQLYLGAETFAAILPFIAVGFVLYRTAVMVLRHRPSRPLIWLGRDLYGRLADPGRIANTALGTFAMLLFFSSFTFLKSLIPHIQPFSWDPVFIGLDRALHFGRDPWEWLYAIAWPPIVISVVNFCYHAWFFLLIGTLFYAIAAVSDRRLRNTFLYAFVLCWAIGGNLFGTLLSSAGPVYAERLGFGSEFHPLMEHLRNAAQVTPVWALDVQEMLWRQYRAHDGLLGGISAMPSMHVAMAVLLALFGFRINRILGYCYAGFAVMIMIGSVALAWHYAVDGYAGAFAAVVCWSAAARLSRPGGWFAPEMN